MAPTTTHAGGMVAAALVMSLVAGCDSGIGGSGSPLAESRSANATYETYLAARQARRDNPVTADAERRWAAELDAMSGATGAAPTAPAAADEGRTEGADLTSTPPLGPDSTIEDYLRAAALANPGLEAAFHRWQAALARAPQVRTLPDPMLTYGVFLREIETRVGPQQHQFALSQRIPWFGTLAAREDAATLAAIAAFHEFDAARLMLFEQVRANLAELWYLERSESIVAEILDLLQQTEPIVRSRLRLDEAGQGDVVRLQIEVARLEDRLRGIQEMGAMRRAMVNSALNLPADDPLPPAPAPIEVRETRPADGASAVAPDPESVRAAIADHPDVLAQRARTARAQVNQELARLSGYPDLTFGLVYTVINDPMMPTQDAGKDPVLVTVGVNIPIWRDRIEAAKRESIAERLASAAGEDAALRRLDSELEQALAELRDARRRRDLYELTLLPKARQVLEITLASLRSDRADLLDLLDAERVLIDLELSLARAEADAATARAAIDRVAGTPIEAPDPQTNTGDPGPEGAPPAAETASEDDQP